MLVPMLEQFVTSTQPIMDQLMKALADENFADAKKATHASAGSAKTAGATQFAEICGAVEKGIHENDLDEVRVRTPQIEPAFDRVSGEIEGPKVS